MNIVSKSLGLVFVMNTPFLADYASKESMGLAVAISAAVEKTAQIVATSGYVWV
jgi:hypothetical protein